MKMSVRNVKTVRPPITAIASRARDRSPPIPNAIGSSPIAVATDKLSHGQVGVRSPVEVDESL